MLDNIEKVFTEKANSVDVAAIDKRLDELREEIERLVKLNVKANLDADIYGIYFTGGENTGKDAGGGGVCVEGGA
ncbi:hypothetical protein [Thermincola ferriacetica]